MFSSSKRSFNISILCNKANHFGLDHDSNLLKDALSSKANVTIVDPLEIPSPSDINIHLEVPIYSYVPWGTYNILVVNPEWYVKAWDPYIRHFDLILTKEYLDIANSQVLPWSLTPFPKTEKLQVKEFLYLLGGSKNKRAFAKQLLSKWKESYPALHVYSTEPLDLDFGITIPSNIILHVKDLSKEERETLLQTYTGHICCSMAEGFGYTAAEANYVGAFTILNNLPVYIQDYIESPNVYWINTSLTKVTQYPYASFVDSMHNIEEQLDLAIEKFQTFSPSPYKKKYDFKTRLFTILDTLPSKTKTVLPPLLERKDCPHISVVTLLYNRKRFFELARHNMILTDYPKNKIQWIIVDDSDNVEEQASDKIIQTIEQFTGMDIHYVPLQNKTPISQKRNIGVEHCSNDIILFMDDDDHYPQTSFRRRVAWLTKHPMKPRATCCTTIACYDLLRGVSAVNCPPFDLPLGQRMSEATLTFYKSWFEERPFDNNIQVGEGDSLVTGREGDVLEIPPQQIIVAFSHDKNTSSRRIPAPENVTPSCFWGFPKEFLTFIHGLAGVNVV